MSDLLATAVAVEPSHPTRLGLACYKKDGSAFPEASAKWTIFAVILAAIFVPWRMFWPILRSAPNRSPIANASNHWWEAVEVQNLENVRRDIALQT